MLAGWAIIKNIQWHLVSLMHLIHWCLIIVMFKFHENILIIYKSINRKYENMFSFNWFVAWSMAHKCHWSCKKSIEAAWYHTAICLTKQFSKVFLTAMNNEWQQFPGGGCMVISSIQNQSYRQVCQWHPNNYIEQQVALYIPCNASLPNWECSQMNHNTSIQYSCVYHATRHIWPSLSCIMRSQIPNE